MILKLTDEQRQALTVAEPLRIVDDQTQKAYILLREEVYEEMRVRLTEPGDVREAYSLMDAVAAKEGWDDPDLDSYNALDPRRPS